MSQSAKDVKKKLSPKLVSLLLAKFYEAGKRSSGVQLDWLEFECDIVVDKIEDIPAFRLDYILNKLEED